MQRSCLTPLLLAFLRMTAQAFGKLRDMLGKTTSADLRSLNFRLDFSEFYADIPAEPSHDSE